MINRVSNKEAGTIWAGWIIAKLAEEWPSKTDLTPWEIIESTGVSVLKSHKEHDIVVDLFSWMIREKYIFADGIDLSGRINSVSITKESFAVLNQVPSSLDGKKLRDEMIDVAKDIGKDATKELARGQLAELFGQFVGGIIKNVSGG
jgi:hypothetical protein